MRSACSYMDLLSSCVSVPRHLESGCNVSCLQLHRAVVELCVSLTPAWAWLYRIQLAAEWDVCRRDGCMRRGIVESIETPPSLSYR